MSNRPNVLIFCADEMRADHMACAGNGLVQTPNLDRLAANGTLFERSYVANPICMPARATMFTGLLPRDHGVRINGQNLCTDLPTLPATLAEAGYRTHAAGKLHLTAWVPRAPRSEAVHYPESLTFWRDGVLSEFPVPYYGFQSVDFVGGHTPYAYGEYIQWLKEQGGDPAELTEENALESPTGAPKTYKMRLPEELHYNRYIADSTIGMIEQAAADDQPFFAWCSFPDPHLPVAPPQPYCEMYDPADVPLPSRSETERNNLPSLYNDIWDGRYQPNGGPGDSIEDRHWQEFIAGTYGMITHMDAEIGRVLNALEQNGLEQNTMVVFLADHGDMMGDHGLFGKSFYTFQGCIRIPTIVRMPGCPGGQVSQALISQLDLLPSVLDACGVDEPGTEWRHTETPFPRGAVHDLNLFPGRSWMGLLDGTRSSIHEAVVIENDDPSTGFRPRTLVTQRYRLTVYPGTGDGELFDLQADPDELHNLWYTDPDMRRDLQAQLLDEYARTTPFYPIPPWNS